MSQIEVDVFDEPPCWGSGEIGLIPSSLQRSLRDKELSGVRFVGTKKKPADGSVQVGLPLSKLTHIGWVRSLKGFTWNLDKCSFVELVIDELDRIFDSDPDALEVPILTKPLDHFDGVADLPLESRTWCTLDQLNFSAPIELITLISGTFREIRERLGDMRASLDLSVTADSWLSPSDRGSWLFRIPKAADEIEELKRIARLRAFRTCGLDPSSSSYSSQFADVIPRNWSVAQGKKWTLDECGEELNLTRERVRQMSKSRLLEPAQRRWVRSSLILEIADAYLAYREEHGDPELNVGSQILRSEASALLRAYGYSDESLRCVESLPTKLKTAGLNPREIRRVAYLASERVGFVAEEVLRLRILEEFPQVESSLLEDLLGALIVVRDLPHGYVYVEGAERSFFLNEVTRLLGLRGSLPFEEVYSAASRYFRVRAPRYLFPPRAVVREFFERDERFLVDGESVDLVEKTPHQLAGVQLWVENRIKESSGCVVHRSTLWNLARRDDISPGTLTVYFSYSLYFKPVGRGCLTLTGFVPSVESIEIAAAKGSMTRVPTRLIGWKVEDSLVLVDVEVGTEMVDNGLLSPSSAIRRLIQPTPFRAIVDGTQRGNIGWSGNIQYGYSTALRALGVEPADHVRLAFDILTGDLNILDLTDGLATDN